MNPFITTGSTQLVKLPERQLERLDKPLEITLVGKEELATDTFVYRFALPDSARSLGHSTCQYLEFEAELLNKETGAKERHKRFYHPLSKVVDQGYVDLLIKVYLRNFKHPQGGLFTQFIDRMVEGTRMWVTAVGGDLVYLGHSQFLLRNKETGLMEPRTFKNIGMIAGGSGIAPMFQVSTSSPSLPLLAGADSERFAERQHEFVPNIL